MTVVLYSLAISHPSRAARKMLELKHVDYELVDIPVGLQRIRLPLAGFRGVTAPALKLDGRRVQGSRAIARALDERYPEPSLFPADPVLRGRVEEAERWGEQEFQPVPRRLFRFAVAHNPELREWVIRAQKLPSVPPVGLAVQAMSAYYARTIEADGRRATEAGVRADLAALPSMLARVDRLLDDGTLTVEEPNAATFQVLSTVATLQSFADLRELVAAHDCAEPARALFGGGSRELPPALPAAWLAPLTVAGASAGAQRS